MWASNKVLPIHAHFAEGRLCLPSAPMIASSATEAEHVALLTTMRDAMCLVHLIKEIKEAGVDLPTASQPKTICRVFEDNVGALELANTHKLRPRTKHLAVQLHHFRQHVLDKTIAVEKVDAQFQRADMFAKASPRDAFRCLRKTIIGW